MGYIYKTTNTINGKIYVGKSIKEVENTIAYFGSGILLRTSIKKYGKENFNKTILESNIQREILNDRETFWINELKSNDKTIGYNLTEGGDGGDCITLNPNRQKIVEKSTGKNNHFYGRHHSDKTKKLISQKQLGRVMSDETKKQISDTLKKQHKSGEIVICKTDTQRKTASIRWKTNNPSSSPQHKIKLSKIMSTETNPSTKWWIFEKIGGLKYKRFSFKQTCKEFGLPYGTMRKWIGKDRFSKAGWKVYEIND